ncbi:hypothetical protein Pmani_016468 [Petrolisthes manimaculis]|uniref:Uncharacterized protein n=1 Tax=Petrolisthes manimaculis TaxID=1843537 RepID=A0AAE1PNV0_9EUCA|nr:hypothetical protein Pmani_016468 [Petrolisthes manimaculis]
MSHAKLTSVAAVDDGVVLEVVVDLVPVLAEFVEMVTVVLDLVLVFVSFVEVLVVTSGRWQWQVLVGSD